MNYFDDDSEPIRFFHLCTDGGSNGIVHTCDEDYRMAIKISAVRSYFTGVTILCYCHMSTHSHFVVCCGNRETAKTFINGFKQDYGRYSFNAHRTPQTYLGIESDPIEIYSSFQLRRCISYVLLNPVVPKVVTHPEDYRWSSFNAYFNADRSTEGFRSVKSMTFREIREIFHTHKDIRPSGFFVDQNRDVVMKSMVSYKLVENLFGSRTEFYRSLAITDSIKEECTYHPQIVRFNDNELLAEAIMIAQKKYGIKDIQSLTHEQKLSLLLPIKRKTSSTALRISKVLRLAPSEVGAYLLKK